MTDQINPTIELACNAVRDNEGALNVAIDNLLNQKQLNQKELLMLNSIVRIQSAYDHRTGEIFIPDDFALHNPVFVYVVVIDDVTTNTPAFSVAFDSEALNRASMQAVMGYEIDPVITQTIAPLICAGIQTQAKQDPTFNQNQILKNLTASYQNLGNYTFQKFQECQPLFDKWQEHMNDVSAWPIATESNRTVH